MSRWWLVAVAALLAVSGSAVTARAQAPGGQGQPRGQERVVTVTNQGGLTLRELYIAPAGAAEPGPDRLGADTLPNGASLQVRLGRVRDCRFDLRAVYSDGSEEERRNLDICNRPRITLGDPGAPLREFTLRNATDQVLFQLFIARPGAQGRGPDRLGSEVVQPGAEFRGRLGRTRDCVFDVTAVFQDETEEARRGVDLCRNPVLGFGDPDAPRRQAEIRNLSGRTIRELYASAAGPDRWGPDRLGSDVLPAGRSHTITIRSRDCVFDLRAVYDDDVAEEKRRVDLCATTTIAFDGSGAPRPPERTLTLVNRHLVPVQEAYLSASRNDEWGDNLLGDEALGTGAQREIAMRGECEADLRIVFAEPPAAEERRGINICEVALVVLRPGWTVADRLDEGEAADRRAAPPRPGTIRLRNAARLPVVELYADAPGGGRGPDRLGATVLGAGETLDFEPPVPGQCAADLVAVFRDGRELVLPGADLCAGVEVTLQ
jgi:hypothetical protein